MVASHIPPTEDDQARNLGRCPDWEPNQQPFGLQAGTQSTEPHQPGLSMVLKNLYELIIVFRKIYPLELIFARG